jgi:hypothetical protein
VKGEGVRESNEGNREQQINQSIPTPDDPDYSLVDSPETQHGLGGGAGGPEGKTLYIDDGINEWSRTKRASIRNPLFVGGTSIQKKGGGGPLNSTMKEESLDRPSVQSKLSIKNIPAQKLPAVEIKYKAGHPLLPMNTSVV